MLLVIFFPNSTESERSSVCVCVCVSPTTEANASEVQFLLELFYLELIKRDLSSELRRIIIFLDD